MVCSATETYLSPLGVVTKSNSNWLHVWEVSDNPEQHLKRWFLMASFEICISWSLAVGESSVSPDEKSSSKLHMHIYIPNYTIGAFVDFVLL